MTTRQRVTYEIIPTTLVVLTSGAIMETPCTDEQAAEWFIYATDSRDGERKCILHAMSRGIAEAVVELFERMEGE